MAVTPIQGFVPSVISTSVGPRASVVAPSESVSSQADSSVAVSSAQLPQQTQVAALQNSSINIAQVGSLLEVAQLGTQQIAQILQQLQSLAEQASQNGSGEPGITLDSEFQLLLSQLNQVAGNTSFGGTSLLNGSTPAPTSADQNVPAPLPNLSPQELFGASQPNLLTASSTTDAQAQLANALGIVDNAGVSIASTQSQVNYTAATVATALANNDASTATLTEADLSAGVVINALGLGSEPADSAQAQTGNLSPSLLSLLQE